MSEQIKDNLRRDLELILVGAALAPESRQSILALIPDSFLSKEGDQLIRAMREGNDPGALLTWLQDRGAGPTRGGTAIDAVHARIVLENAKQSLKRIALNVQNTAKLGTVKQLVGALEKSLEIAKGLEEIDE